MFDLIEVHSDFYPGLEAFYRQQAEEWAECVRAERHLFELYQPSDEQSSALGEDEVSELQKAGARRSRKGLPPTGALARVIGSPKLLSKLWRRLDSVPLILELIRLLDIKGGDRALRMFSTWCAQEAVRFLRSWHFGRDEELESHCGKVLAVCRRFVSGKANAEQLKAAGTALEPFVQKTEFQTMFGRKYSATGAIVRACVAATQADPWKAASQASGYAEAAFDIAQRTLFGVTPERPDGDEEVNRKAKQIAQAKGKGFEAARAKQLRKFVGDIL